MVGQGTYDAPSNVLFWCLLAANRQDFDLLFRMGECLGHILFTMKTEPELAHIEGGPTQMMTAYFLFFNDFEQ